MTIHSFAGIGKGEDALLDLLKRIKRNKRVKEHWEKCETLIIDEVSMVCTYRDVLLTVAVRRVI